MTSCLALLSAALFGAGRRSPAATCVGGAARAGRPPGLLAGSPAGRSGSSGRGAEIAGFVLQVIALRHGSLVVVQPLLTTSLLFTIALVGHVDPEPVTRAEWAAVIAVVVGAGQVPAVARRPSEAQLAGSTSPDWVVTGLSIGAALGAAPGAGGPTPGSAGDGRSPSGLAAGLGRRFMAVLTKAFAHVTDRTVSVLTSWVPYALCAAGVDAMVLTQTAYQTGLPKSPCR